ncbi:MAG: phosphate ABC transporter permease PstA [Desulfomonilaceae bacterium]
MTKFIETAATFLSYACAILTVTTFVIFVGFLVSHGLTTINLSLFFGDVSPYDALFGNAPVWDGIWPAVVGTALLVFFSCILAVPLGISAGIFLAEYTVSRPIRSIIDFAIDLLAGMPSIIMGLFGFAMVLFLRKTFLPEANTCLLLSSVCIAFLVLPYLIRTTQTALVALPAAVRLTGIGLGFTKWQNILHVLIPLSSRGIMSGVILSIGRAAEDTAVILLTGVVANSGLPGAITDKFEALPFTIYYLAAEYRTPEELNRGFGAALVLLILTGTLFQAANWLHNRISGESR